MPVMPKTDRCKLLIVCQCLTGGGAERTVSTLLTHLDRSVFDPSLVLLREEVSYPVPNDTSVTSLDYDGWGTRLRTVRRLRSHIDKLQPDLVLSSIAYMAYFVARALKEIERRPKWIARIGNHPSLGLRGWRRLADGMLLPRSLQQADHFIANSHGLARAFSDFLPTSRGRIRVLYNPCDVNALVRLASQDPVCRAERGVPVLLSVGRLEPRKRPDLLVDAFAKIQQQVAAQLWICGDGPLREAVKRQIQQLGLTRSVKILGFSENPFAVMKQATLFVLSSDTEGLPNALIEAQALGLPAVATRCPFGPEEIIEEGQTGRLVPVGDASALADAVLDYLGDAVKISEASRQAALRARERFDVAKLLPAWTNVLWQAWEG